MLMLYVMYVLQFCTCRQTSLYSPVNDLHGLEKLIIMLLGRDDLDAER